MNMERENDEDWYFFDDGEPEFAAVTTDDKNNVGTLLKTEGYAVNDASDGWRYRAKIKVEGMIGIYTTAKIAFLCLLI